jgi:hypothetical protein
MGASSSTIRDSVCSTFAKSDAGKRGYLVSASHQQPTPLRPWALSPPGCPCHAPMPRAQTIKELLKLPHLWGVDTSHLGVLWALDR